MTTLLNRRWSLARRPTGIPRREDFTLVEEEIAPDEISPGQVLVRNLYTLCAPDQRNWMNEQVNFHPPLALGDTVLGPTVSRVIASTHPKYTPGMLLFTLGGWSHYSLIDVASLHVPLVPYPSGTDPIEALGVLGMNQLAAYFGMKKIAEPRPGELLVVSGAAGSTGSAAAQLGLIMGCEVVGIAGGGEKCAWLTEVCGISRAIDYHAENVAEVLARDYRDRINIFYDNVGGSILQAGFDNMAPHGRIVICGMVSGYLGDGNLAGPDNFMRIVHGAIKMQGFVAQHWADEFPGALAELKRWLDLGLIKHREDVRAGLENLPEIYAELFRGENRGTLIVKLSED